MEKRCSSERVTHPAKSTLASVYLKKKLTPFARAKTLHALIVSALDLVYPGWVRQIIARRKVGPPSSEGYPIVEKG